MSNTKLPALPPHPAIRDGITWRDDERKAIDEYARAAILADRERQAGEAVARVRTWTKNGEGHGELVDWLGGADALPDGEHDLYAATIASLPAPQAVQAGCGHCEKGGWCGRRDCENIAAAPSPDGKAEQAEAPSYAPLTGRIHDLKIDGPVFSEVAAGRKLFEIRKNDRGFQCGDLLRLRETRLTGAEMAAGEPLIYTGRERTVRVIGIIHGPKYGLADGFCVMSIAAQPTASNAGERDDLHNFTTHRASWRKAIETLAKQDDSGYWQHELKAYDDAMVSFDRAALASKPPAGEQKPVEGGASYTLTIVADSGYEATTEGRCTAEQYGAAIGALHGVIARPEQVAQDAEHAENYRLIRRGQHWSVVDGIGNTLRGEDLDDAVGAIRAARARG